MENASRAAQAGGTVESGSDARRLLLQRLWIFGVPFVARVLVVAATLVVARWLVHVPRYAPAAWLQTAVIVGAPLLLLALWEQLRLERIAREVRFEPTLNHRAIEWLRTADWSRMRDDGEAPREMVYLPGWRARWLLVTNRRIVLFAASGRVQGDWPRRAVLFAGPPEQLAGATPRSLWSRLWAAPPNLALQLDDGTELALRCASAVTAQRVAQVLMMGATVSVWAREGATAAAPVRRRWREVAAALVVPGSGQWLQGRFATASVLFTAAVLVCVLTWGPVLWALQRSHGDVPRLHQLAALLDWLLLSLVAAADALHFSATRRGPA